MILHARLAGIETPFKYKEFDVNRITSAVQTITTKLATLEADKLENLEVTSELDTPDWLTFGDKSSRALLSGLVTADEAQTLYQIHSRYNGTATLAEKITYLQVMGELLPRI